MPNPPAPPANTSPATGASPNTDTSSGTATSQPLQNPPDPRDNRPVFNVALTPDFTGPPLGALNGFRTVGYMREDFSDTGQARIGGPFALYFMYNPTEIDISYGFDPSQTPPDFLSQDANAAPRYTTNKTLSFSLFFDRSYEVWQDKNHPGTYMDQRAAERMLGIWDSLGGPPISTRVRILFGGFGNSNTTTSYQGAGGQIITNPANPLAGAGALVMTGYPISLDITHTRFDRALTPIHCAMDWSIQLVYNPLDQPVSRSLNPLDNNGPNSALVNTGTNTPVPIFRRPGVPQ
jgi:hypothetical protein